MTDVEMDVPTAGQRLLALGALMAGGLAIALGVMFVIGDPVQIVVAVVALVLAVTAVWYAVTTRGWRRALAIGLVVVAGLSVGGALLFTQYRGDLVLRDAGEATTVALVIVLVAVSLLMATRAVQPSVEAIPACKGATVTPLRAPAAIMNPWSGGGKVGRFGLAGEAKARGVEPIVLEAGEDLRQLVLEAIDRGADGLGAAGGDGTQAVVAELAAEHDIPFICIPAGTRNHFALDLGLDRDDVIAALDAFGDAVEVKVDLARVNGRTFVNNASMGLYAKIVHSDAYRAAKAHTAGEMLPELLGPDAEPFDLCFIDGDGARHRTTNVLLVSNNEYQLDRPSGFATRERMDDGRLGVFSVTIESAAELRSFIALQAVGRSDSFSGVARWSTERFVVESDGPIEIGVDGEALMMDPPLVFESMPGALRVRVPPGSPGQAPSPAKVALSLDSARRLVSIAAGRTSPVG
jgi:diacylglycerol kinase family enzyme